MDHLQYYKSPAVRHRIAEYCGAKDGEPGHITAEYLVGYGESLLWDGLNNPFCSTNIDGFNWILDKGLDIFRSNWDKKYLIGVIDVEYVNFDFPGEPYFHANETYQKLEPLYRTIINIFSEYGLAPLVLVTGQGYHFVFQIHYRSRAQKELENIGNIPYTLTSKYRTFSLRRRKVSLKYGHAFDAMGRLMEFLAHKIIVRSAGVVDIPIHITDVLTGTGKAGREIISIDLSMYGDPVYMRDIRCAFSTHQKHRVQKYKVGENIAYGTPIQICIPRQNLSLDEILSIRRDYAAAITLAQNTSTFIPVRDKEALKIIADYKSSDLFSIHNHIDSIEHHDFYDWPHTYDQINLDELPPCVSHSLKNPNDHLLKPTNIQTITRTLMALGWHPAHIIGLIRSKYERDYGWGTAWFKYDAFTRAKFYVRVFASQILNKIDNFDDYNCVSHREKGYCYMPFCGKNLGDFAEKLMKKREEIRRSIGI